MFRRSTVRRDFALALLNAKNQFTDGSPINRERAAVSARELLVDPEKLNVKELNEKSASIFLLSALPFKPLASDHNVKVCLDWLLENLKTMRLNNIWNTWHILRSVQSHTEEDGQQAEEAPSTKETSEALFFSHFAPVLQNLSHDQINDSCKHSLIQFLTAITRIDVEMDAAILNRKRTFTALVRTTLSHEQVLDDMRIQDWGVFLSASSKLDVLSKESSEVELSLAEVSSWFDAGMESRYSKANEESTSAEQLAAFLATAARAGLTYSRGMEMIVVDFTNRSRVGALVAADRIRFFAGISRVLELSPSSPTVRKARLDLRSSVHHMITTLGQHELSFTQTATLAHALAKLKLPSTAEIKKGLPTALIEALATTLHQSYDEEKDNNVEILAVVSSFQAVCSLVKTSVQSNPGSFPSEKSPITSFLLLITGKLQDTVPLQKDTFLLQNVSVFVSLALVKTPIEAWLTDAIAKLLQAYSNRLSELLAKADGASSGISIQTLAQLNTFFVPSTTNGLQVLNAAVSTHFRKRIREIEADDFLKTLRVFYRALSNSDSDEDYETDDKAGEDQDFSGTKSDSSLDELLAIALQQKVLEKLPLSDARNTAAILSTLAGPQVAKAKHVVQQRVLEALNDSFREENRNSVLELLLSARQVLKSPEYKFSDKKQSLTKVLQVVKVHIETDPSVSLTLIVRSLELLAGCLRFESEGADSALLGEKNLVPFFDSVLDRMGKLSSTWELRDASKLSQALITLVRGDILEGESEEKTSTKAEVMYFFHETSSHIVDFLATHNFCRPGSEVIPIMQLLALLRHSAARAAANRLLSQSIDFADFTVSQLSHVLISTAKIRCWSLKTCDELFELAETKLDDDTTRKELLDLLHALFRWKHFQPSSRFSSLSFMVSEKLFSLPDQIIEPPHQLLSCISWMLSGAIDEQWATHHHTIGTLLQVIERALTRDPRDVELRRLVPIVAKVIKVESVPSLETMRQKILASLSFPRDDLETWIHTIALFRSSVEATSGQLSDGCEKILPLVYKDSTITSQTISFIGEVSYTLTPVSRVSKTALLRLAPSLEPCLAVFAKGDWELESGSNSEEIHNLVATGCKLTLLVYRLYFQNKSKELFNSWSQIQQLLRLTPTSSNDRLETKQLCSLLAASCLSFEVNKLPPDFLVSKRHLRSILAQLNQRKRLVSDSYGWMAIDSLMTLLKIMTRGVEPGNCVERAPTATINSFVAVFSIADVLSQSLNLNKISSMMTPASLERLEFTKDLFSTLSRKGVTLPSIDGLRALPSAIQSKNSKSRDSRLGRRR